MKPAVRLRCRFRQEYVGSIPDKAAHKDAYKHLNTNALDRMDSGRVEHRSHRPCLFVFHLMNVQRINLPTGFPLLRICIVCY